jgi:hypothetical protein
MADSAKSKGDGLRDRDLGKVKLRTEKKVEPKRVSN